MLGWINKKIETNQRSSFIFFLFYQLEKGMTLIIQVLLITQLTTILFKIRISAMDTQQISIRISQCVDDLGLLLDQIYKFPQKQRQNYFQKIQSLKNKLLGLKGNLRENNIYNIEKQYKQVYLTMNGLKNQINIQSNALSAAKENKDVQNRFKDVKELKRNYEDAMKLILQKDSEISILNKQLYEKEELIQINFQEINRLKSDLQIVCEQNRRLKFEHTTLLIDLQAAKASVGRTSDFTMEYMIREQEKDKVFQSALDELERLKCQLIAANQKINHFEQLAQISMKKTKLVEENIKKVQREAQDFNENYRMKENENFKKLRQFGQLTFQINNKSQQIKQLELQNRRLKEDILVQQSQIKKLNKLNNDYRIVSNEQKEKLYLEHKRLNNEIENGIYRESDLKRVIDEWEKKYLVAISKLNAVEEFKIRNQQLSIKIKTLQQKLIRSQQLLQDSKRQNLILAREKEKLANQMESQSRSLREIQIQNYKFREKVKLKDQQRIKLIQDLEIYQSKLKEAQKALALHSVSFQALQSQIVQEKTRLIRYEQKNRVKEKEIENLKIKLLKAKIQTIHQIREVIN